MNVLLIGPRGSGKSTVGKPLAELLGAAFIDLDERVLESFGERSVQTVWDGRGEPAWREAEATVLARLVTADRQVIALGGGTPTEERALATIEGEKGRSRAVVIYLRCDLPTLADRLGRAPGDRPRLASGTPSEEIAAVLARREPIYRHLADVEVDVTDRTPDEAASTIAAELDRLRAR